MLILAIEQSTSRGSIALLADTGLLEEQSWDDNAAPNQHLFARLPRLLDRAGLGPADVEAYAVGLGPGSFSGLRISLSAARAMALPDGRPVYGRSSAEALARQCFRDHGITRAAVVGDARRRRLWFARFEASATRLETRAPLELLAADALSESLEPGDTLVSPDWDRIGPQLLARCPAGIDRVEEPRVPRARDVAELVALGTGEDRGGPGRPPDPIYLHPPVFAKPGSHKKL